MPTSCPGFASVATTSPMLRLSFSEFLKKSFLPFLKRISTTSKGVWSEGYCMLDNQSKTGSLLQLSVPQFPLFPHPLGVPVASFFDEQLVHPIYLETTCVVVLLVNKSQVKILIICQFYSKLRIK